MHNKVASYPVGMGSFSLIECIALLAQLIAIMWQSQVETELARGTRWRQLLKSGGVQKKHTCNTNLFGGGGGGGGGIHPLHFLRRGRGVALPRRLGPVSSLYR